MEFFGTFWALVPPLVAIVLALITKETYTSLFVGIVVGLFAEKLNVNEGEFSKKDVVTYAIANVIAHAVAWIGVAPVLDILIYAEPVDKVFAQGAMAAVANILTAVIVGALLIAAYTKTIAKKGSLEKQ